MKNSSVAFVATLSVLAITFMPSLGFCDVQGTLENIQLQLVDRILPLCAVLGLVFSAFSFFTGNPNARSHLWLAIIGMVVGFGAESIMRFIQSLVH